MKDFLYKDLRKLKIQNKNKKDFISESIPSLREVLEWLTTNQLICNIELKNGVFPYEGMEEKVIELLYSFNLKERIIISSFNHYSLVYCYRIDNQIETAPLFSEGLYMPWVYAQSIGAKGIHPKYTVARSELVKASEDYGIAVRPYTVNKETVMKRLIEVGSSAFITDDPRKAFQIREECRYK